MSENLPSLYFEPLEAYGHLLKAYKDDWFAGDIAITPLLIATATEAIFADGWTYDDVRDAVEREWDVVREVLKTCGMLVEKESAIGTVYRLCSPQEVVKHRMVE